MPSDLPRLFLARHGDTAWTESRQHTGRTDLALNEAGEARARQIGEKLRRYSFAAVFTSPLQRARRTCELAGFGAQAEVLADAIEWNYGKYEGVKTVDIHRERPDWDLFRDGCPDGENAAMIGARADRVIARIRAVNGDAIVFSSSHFLRVFAARWIGLPPTGGSHFVLSTAAVNMFGYEHNKLTEPVIQLWNDAKHTQD
jgi:broad specificity phosphatase PhoE